MAKKCHATPLTNFSFERKTYVVFFLEFSNLEGKSSQRLVEFLAKFPLVLNFWVFYEKLNLYILTLVKASLVHLME